jgi:hypothetical protein
MKKVTLSILICFIVPLISFGQTDIYSIQNEKIHLLEQSVKNLQTENNLIKKQSKLLNENFIKQQKLLNNLNSQVSNNTENIKKTADETGTKITETNASIITNKTTIEQNLKSKSIFVGIILLITIIILVVIYFLLRKRINISKNAIDKINDTQKILQEESLKLDGKLIEIFETQIKIQESQPISSKEIESDHSLVLKVADEIVRIETNLSRMDSGIKGFKQLAASVRRIKDNLLANDYELIDMLGKPYDEGMRVFADFVVDENLNAGERIITTIIKPQINFKGELIQKAKITVSQNI